MKINLECLINNLNASKSFENQGIKNIKAQENDFLGIYLL